MRHIALVVIAALATPIAADAQQGIGKKVMAVFSAPVHPIVKSVGPGGGFGPASPTSQSNVPTSPGHCGPKL
jgi:hypothetical protein